MEGFALLVRSYDNPSEYAVVDRGLPGAKMSQEAQAVMFRDDMQCIMLAATWEPDGSLDSVEIIDDPFNQLDGMTRVNKTKILS